MNNFGIIEAFIHAGLVNKIIFLLLIMLSIFSWAIAVKKYQEFRLKNKQLDSFKKIINIFNEDAFNNYSMSFDHEYADVIAMLLETSSKKLSKEDLQEAYAIITNPVINNLEKELNIFATLANSAPFIGLFGTVLGVINSFQQIGQQTSASLSVIAPGIAEALYATAIGLFVAVPASVFYNVFNSKLENISLDQDQILEKILYVLKIK